MLWMVVGALSVMNWFEVPINKQLTEVNQHGNGEWEGTKYPYSGGMGENNPFFQPV